ETIHLIVDPVSSHRSAELAVWLAYRPWRRFVFHYLPVHSSWLSFIEVWFSILSRKCLKRARFPDATTATREILAFIATYDTYQAHPFTWKQGGRFLERLAANLSLLADLSHADLLLYCPDGSEAVVVAEGCPEPVPSLYSGRQLGRRLDRAAASSVFRVLFDGRSRQHFSGVMIL